jgi:hypothetical protein
MGELEDWLRVNEARQFPMAALGAPNLKPLHTPPIRGLDTLAAYCREKFDIALTYGCVRRLIARLALLLRVEQDAVRDLTIEQAAEALMATRQEQELPSDRPDSEYQLRLVGKVWHVRYLGEEGDYPAEDNQALGWLAKLLAASKRLLTMAELRGDPEGKLTADAMLGSEREADRTAINAIKRQLEDIDEVANTAGWSAELEKQKADLLDRLKTAAKALNPTLKREHHNVATQLRALYREKLVKDMPLLAAHLQEWLKLDYPYVGYDPPDPPPTWHC